MSQYRIAIVIGSLRHDSFNRKLAAAVMRLAPPELIFKQSQIGDLPLYNQDDDGNQAESVKRLKSRNYECPRASVRHARIQSFDAGRTQERD